MTRLTGVLLVAVSASCFGTLPIFARYAYDDGMDVPTVLFLRFSLAAAVMLVVMAVTAEAWPSGRVLLTLAAMGAIGYVGQSFAFLSALEHASAGLVSLLLYLYPTFVAVLAFLFLREQVTAVKVISIVLAFVGAAFVAGPEGGEAIGIVFAITAALIYSVYIIVGAEVMEHVSEVQSSTVIFLAAGVSSGALMLAGGADFPETGEGWGAVLGIVLLGTTLPVVSFLAGMDRIGPTNAATISKLEPVVTILLAAWLFDERLLPVALLGGALILVAVALLARAEPNPREEHIHSTTRGLRED